MSIKYESWFSTILGLSLNSTDTVITLGVAPTVTKGRMYIFDWIQKEWVDFTGVSGVTITWCTRNVSSTADPMTGGTGYNFNAGTPVVLVAMHDQLPDKTTANTFVGDQTITGALTVSGLTSFTGTNTPWLRLKSLTTTQRDALTPATGDKIINTTTGTEQTYYGGTWNDAGTSTVANASTTVTGKVQLATTGQANAGTDTDGGDPLVIIPSQLKGVADSVASVVSTVNTLSTARFGTGVDWAIGAWGLTITGSNNTYILKQYTSFAPWSNTVTITPTNCILHIKIQGNCDLTGTTFNFLGKWWPWGWGTFSGAASNGTKGNWTTCKVWEGTWSGATATSWAGQAPLFSYNPACDAIIAACGGWGGGGNGEGFNIGDSGGAGGGCVILEIGGDLTYSWTTATVAGWDYIAGGGHAGAGGGWGGCFFVFYRGTKTGSLTPTVTGGAGRTLTNNGSPWASLINNASGINGATWLAYEAQV